MKNKLILCEEANIPGREAESRWDASMVGSLLIL